MHTVDRALFQIIQTIELPIEIIINHIAFLELPRPKFDVAQNRIDAGGIEGVDDLASP